MNITGRIPTMRHVSGTHRVALDWCFDRTNLDPKIRIKFVVTKIQLADILTKVSFARDERNYLLRSCNIMNISKFASSRFRSISYPWTVSTRPIGILTAKKSSRLDISRLSGYLQQKSSRLDFSSMVMSLARDSNENAASSSQETDNQM